MEFTGLSRTTVITTLKFLVDKKLLIKRDEQVNGIYLPKYKANLEIVNCTGSTDSVLPGTDSVPYNIVDNINTPSFNSLSKDKELKNEEYNVEQNSTSPKNNSSLENFRKTYITNSQPKKSSRKKEEPNQEVANEVIEYLNKVSGKRYSSKTALTANQISARYHEGYTIDDMKRVIEHRWKLWKGTDMEQYFRPSTLFRPGNFENYFNSLQVKRVPDKAKADTANKFGVDNKTVYKDVSGNNKTSGVIF